MLKLRLWGRPRIKWRMILLASWLLCISCRSRMLKLSIKINSFRYKLAGFKLISRVLRLKSMKYMPARKIRKIISLKTTWQKRVNFSTKLKSYNSKQNLSRILMEKERHSWMINRSRLKLLLKKPKQKKTTMIKINWISQWKS